MAFYHQILFVFDTLQSDEKSHVDATERHHLKKNIDRFKGSFEYKCWTLPDAYEFTKQHYPFLTCIFDIETKYNIIKCDFFRYLLMYHFGGLYTDIDFLCIKPIHDFVQAIVSSALKNVDYRDETPCIVFTEEWHESMKLTQTIHNGFLYSQTSKHPFWIQLIMEIYDQLIVKQIKINYESDVYEISGPKKLCSFYTRYKNTFDGIFVLPYYYCCPYIAILKSTTNSGNSETEPNTVTVLCNTSNALVPDLAKSVWVFFRMDHYDNINTLCPESFFVNVNLKSGSMWK